MVLFGHISQTVLHIQVVVIIIGTPGKYDQRWL